MTVSRPEARSLSEEVARGREEIRGMGAAAAEIAGDFSELANLELALVRAEIADNLARLKQAGMFGGIAALFGFWVIGFLGVTMMLALALVWPDWLAALATAGTLLLITGIAGAIAYTRMKAFSPTPRRSLASIREDVAWARGLMKRNGGSASSGRGSSTSSTPSSSAPKGT